MKKAYVVVVQASPKMVVVSQDLESAFAKLCSELAAETGNKFYLPDNSFTALWNALEFLGCIHHEEESIYTGDILVNPSQGPYHNLGLTKEAFEKYFTEFDMFNLRLLA